MPSGVYERTEDHKRKLSENHSDQTCENNNNWSGGCDEYWAREMKKIYTECVLCRSDILLEMHHIDGNRKNNDRSNRVILCMKCHKFWHYN